MTLYGHRETLLKTPASCTSRVIVKIYPIGPGFVDPGSRAMAVMNRGRGFSNASFRGTASVRPQTDSNSQSPTNIIPTNHKVLASHPGPGRRHGRTSRRYHPPRTTHAPARRLDQYPTNSCSPWRSETPYCLHLGKGCLGAPPDSATAGPKHFGMWGHEEQLWHPLSTRSSPNLSHQLRCAALNCYGPYHSFIHG